MSDYGDDDLDDVSFSTPAPLPAGVTKEVIKEAEQKNWRQPKAGDEVTVDYVGSFEDGKEFDSSHSHDEPCVFTLGEGKVIKGWELGIPTMRKGEVAKFTIAPEFAYGERGSPPTIPPNTTLVFKVELISWIARDDLFKDGGVTKSVVAEGDGWECPKLKDEIRMSLKVTSEKGDIIKEATSFDYVLGSGDLGDLTKVVDKALLGMKKDEKVSLRCTKDYIYKGTDYGAVTIELHHEETYVIGDVSLMKDETLMKKQIKEGEGYDKPKEGKMVTLKIESVTDGVNPIEGFSGPQERRFIVGNGDVCDALEFAVVEMKQGERALLTCTAPAKAADARLGLGKLSAPKVVFTLELIRFEKTENQWNISDEEKVIIAGDRKELAAKLFKEQRYELALDKYKKIATDLKDSGKKLNDEFKRESDELKKSAENNKAACFLKLQDWGNLLSTCNGILKADHSNIKALFRRARAYHERGEHALAQVDLDKLLELEPGNADAKALLPHIKRAQKKADSAGKSTYSNMVKAFGKMGERKEDQPKPKPKPEPPKEKVDTVAVTFTIEYPPKEGETVHIFGSSELLGKWEEGNSVEMRLLPQKWEPPVGSGREKPKVYMWEVVLDIPQGEEIVEYKYLIRGPNGVRKEKGSNHKVHVKGMGGSRQKRQDTFREEVEYEADD